MRHLIISREYPPAVYPGGRIGTYVANIARLMAERGETVHVIGERWKGAPLSRETSHQGRLVVHRIRPDDLVEVYPPVGKPSVRVEIEGLRNTEFPNQWFSWRAAFLVEWLILHDGIDVIEGQEWEAPLYYLLLRHYLLLRRALGLGPERSRPASSTSIPRPNSPGVSPASPARRRTIFR